MSVSMQWTAWCFCLLISSFLVDAAWPQDSSDETVSMVGQKVEDFTLADFRGKPTSLSDLRDAKVVVIAFLGTECPIVQLYAKRLQQLADQHRGQGVVVIGIDSNQQDSLAEMEHFARTHGIRFSLLKDPGNRVADQFRAERTPEVFVLDSNHVVRYHGRIDEQYTYEIQRSKKEHDYVTDAVTQLLAGQTVAVSETEVVGCQIGRTFATTVDDGVTYADQISRILERRCVECHREGEIAPFALAEYDEVVGWAPMIEEVVRQERMPPWHAAPQHGSFANDRRLSDEEKLLVYKWIQDGAPLGDPARLPKPRSYVSGWQLPQEPDLVIPMRETPVSIPAEGEIAYKYFRYDPKFTEDKWISMAECVPGNRKVVHHILVFAQPPGSKRIAGERGGFLAAYVPGLRARPYPPGMAKRVPAGSQLLFQVHYTPIGTRQSDLSSLGLVFTDREQVMYEVKTTSAVDTRFTIPPGNNNYRVEALSPRAPIQVDLLAMMPHMHLRGKAFRYEALYPGGTNEILLDVPRYDFNWQTTYRLATAKTLPPGTRIRCTAHFDNSKENLANPDHTATVQWGEQTWDEMMIGYFDVAVPLR